MGIETDAAGSAREGVDQGPARPRREPEGGLTDPPPRGVGGRLEAPERRIAAAEARFESRAGPQDQVDGKDAAESKPEPES